jgi:hypothetical protein
MLVGGMVDDELGDDANAAGVRRRDEALEFGERSVILADVAIFGDVVAVILSRRRIEGEEPDRVYTEAVDIVELCVEAGEIADAVVVGVEERFDVQLIDYRVLVPERVLDELRLRSFRHPSAFN